MQVCVSTNHNAYGHPPLPKLCLRAASNSDLANWMSKAYFDLEVLTHVIAQIPTARKIVIKKRSEKINS